MLAATSGRGNRAARAAVRIATRRGTGWLAAISIQRKDVQMTFHRVLFDGGHVSRRNRRRPAVDAPLRATAMSLAGGNRRGPGCVSAVSYPNRLPGVRRDRDLGCDDHRGCGGPRWRADGAGLDLLATWPAPRSSSPCCVNSWSEATPSGHGGLGGDGRSVSCNLGRPGVASMAIAAVDARCGVSEGRGSWSCRWRRCWTPPVMTVPVYGSGGLTAPILTPGWPSSSVGGRSRESRA